MEFNRKNAMKIWEEAFGRDVMSVDFSGRKIQKGAYQQITSNYGWVLAPILPKSEGGNTEPENLVCLHVRTAEEKSDSYPTFKANDVRYNIVANGGKWTIEQSEDNEAMAELEALVAYAMSKWEELFGDVSSATDFCGREIIKEQFASDCAGAWKIAPYVTSKPAENKNAYIAHVESVEEAYGKTAFRANGRQFTLNKDNGTYFFKESAIKPQRRSFDLGNPLSVAERIDRSLEEFAELAEKGVWLDFILVSAIIEPGVAAYTSAALTDTISFILREHLGSWLSSEVSEMPDADGGNHVFMTFRFTSPQVSDMERVFNAAMLLNTYSSMLTAKFGLRMFKVYNYANNFSGNYIHYPDALLTNYSQEFQELLGAFYASEGGMYEGEAATTLYVSRFVIFNIPALSEAHAEDAQYFTAAQLVEHNYIYSGLKDAIDSYLVPSPEPSIPEFDPEPAIPEMPETAEPEVAEDVPQDMPNSEPGGEISDEPTDDPDDDDEVYDDYEKKRDAIFESIPENGNDSEEEDDEVYFDIDSDN